MSVTPGYTNYPHEKSDALKERFDFAKRVLKEGLGIEVESLEPIARGYNNKVYLLKIFPSSSPTAPPRALAPGCVPFPERTPEYLIFRTVRHVSQVPAARKLLNAVAALELIRNTTDIPVTRPYAYDASGEEVWMVEGKLPGVPMDELWQTADTAERLGMLEALADVLAKLKSMPVPGGSKYRFGGLTYDSDDKIVLGPTCLGYDEGPFTTAKEHYRAWIVGQWEDCKKNARADGWKVDGLHERIEKFINEGLESTMSCLDDCEPVFIHADFGFLNTLVSETAPHVITGLLDYEWSHFGPPSDEYFLSSPAPGLIYGGPHDAAEDTPSMITAKNLMSGAAPDLLESDKAFFTFKMDAMLKARGVGTFSTIPHFEQISRLYWFGEFLRPWFFHPTTNYPEEKVQEKRAQHTAAFDKDLKLWGY